MRGVQAGLLHQRVAIDLAVDVRGCGAVFGCAQREDAFVDDRVRRVLLKQGAQALDRFVGIKFCLTRLGDTPEHLNGLGGFKILHAVHDHGLRFVYRVVGGLAVGGDALDGAGAFEQVAQVGGGVDAEVVLLQLIDVGVHGLGALRFLHEGQDAQQHLSARGHGFEQVVDALGRRAIIGFRFGLLCGCIGCRADGGVIAALAIIVVRAGVLQRVELVKLGFKG